MPTGIVLLSICLYTSNDCSIFLFFLFLLLIMQFHFFSIYFIMIFLIWFIMFFHSLTISFFYPKSLLFSRCFCTEERLHSLRKQFKGNSHIYYDRRCYHLTASQVSFYSPFLCSFILFTLFFFGIFFFTYLSFNWFPFFSQNFSD